MIITDGFVMKDTKRGVTHVTLVQKDVKILEKFKRELESDHRIIIYGENNCGKVSVYSVKIVNDLIKLGIPYKEKSTKLKFPKVPEEYLPHFIRGVIDGDEWVQDKGYVISVVTASKEFSEGLLKVFKMWGLRSEIKINKGSKQTEIFRVKVIGRESILKLESIIYKDCGDLYYEYKRNRMLQNEKYKDS